MPLVLSQRLLLLCSIFGCAAAQFDRRGGSANELGGIWFGEEKFPWAEGTGRFCSRVSMEEPNFRTYFTAENTCEENDVDPVNKEIGSAWFDNTDAEFNFIEMIDGWECTPSDECADVISDPDDDDPTSYADDYHVVARACGRQVKKEHSMDMPWSCDAWQITLLKKDDKKHGDDSDDESDDDNKKGRMDSKDHKGSKGTTTKGYHGRKLNRRNKKRKLMKKKKDEKKGDRKKHDRKSGSGSKHQYDGDGDYLVVLTVAYSNNFETRSEIVDACPDKAVYRMEDIEDSEFAIGATQYVLQASSKGNDLTNPCNWDCFDDHEYCDY